MIAKPWGHKDVVPIGPAALTWAFDDALAGIDVRRQVRQDIYKEFEIVLHTVLANLYPAISKMLEESGVFPSLEELREAMQRSMRRGAPKPRPEPTQNYQELEGPVREAAMAADGISTAPRTSYNPFAPIREGGTAEVYKAARELLNLGRRARRMQGAPDEVEFAPPNAAPDQRYDPKDILQAISQIESELGDAPVTDSRLKPRLMEVLKAQPRRQEGIRRRAVRHLGRDGEPGRFDRAGQAAHRRYSRLGETVGDHPQQTRDERSGIPRPRRGAPALGGRGVEPVGANWGTRRTSGSASIAKSGSRVDELLERIVKDYDRNPEVFEDVLEELSPLVERQARAYRGNVERTVRASEGQQKLARARRAVARQLEPRLAGKDVPELFLRLMNPGWRNLLVHTHLRHGPNSNEWRDASATAEEVLAQLTGESKPGSAGFVEPETLLKRVVAGLNSISFEPGKRTPLVMGLSDALVGDTTGAKAKVKLTKIGANETEKALGLEGLLPDASPAIETDDEDIRKNWSRALDRARRMSVGEWLAMSDEQGRPLILSVAFIGDDYAFFVLVNRKGVKSREIPLKEMADGLHRGARHAARRLRSAADGARVAAHVAEHAQPADVPGGARRPDETAQSQRVRAQSRGRDRKREGDERATRAVLPRPRPVQDRQQQQRPYRRRRIAEDGRPTPGRRSQRSYRRKLRASAATNSAC